MPNHYTPEQKLSPQQYRFVAQYVIEPNATQAAIVAGYKHPLVQGPRLLGNVRVQQAIAEAQKDRQVRTGITQDRVLRELASLGFSNMADYAEWDTGGVRLKSSDSLTREQTSAVIQVEEHKTVTVKTSKDGDVFETTTTQVKFKLADKEGALDKLGRHLGMYPKEAGDHAIIVPVQVIINDKSNI